MKITLLIASLALSVAVHAQSWVSTDGQRNTLIEEATGAWCGYCPNGAEKLEAILASNPRAIGVSIHDNNDGITGNQNQYDIMEIAAGDSFCIVAPMFYKTGPYSHTDSLSVFQNGYPSASIDRTQLAVNRGAWASTVTSDLAVAPKVDLLMTHKYDAATKTITITLTAKALTALTGKANFNVYITEDSIASVAPQSTGTMQHWYNGSPDAGSKWIGKGSVDPNYSGTWDLTTANCGYYHMNVLRAMLGNFYGTAHIFPDNCPKDTVRSVTYTYTIPSGQVASHLKIVGLVQTMLTGDFTNAKILNAVQAKFSPTLEIPNVNNIAGLTIAPNPANDMIHITANTNVTNLKLTVTNMIGQMVYTKVLENTGNSVNEYVSVANFNNGIYLVNITGDGVSQTQKVIVNK